MEDVLDVDEEPYDPRRPTVCFDETPTPLIAEKRAPVPARPRHPERFDYEYERHGTRDLFLFCRTLRPSAEGLRGWSFRGRMAVTERRTRQDFARQVRWLVDEAYPQAERVRVVLDNLNPRPPRALCNVCPR